MGEEGKKANVDFLIVTSHTPKKNRTEFLEIFDGEGYYGKTLVIAGEEVDEGLKRNHILVLGGNKWIGNRKDFDSTLREIKDSKYVSLIPHPDGRMRLFLVPKEYKWKRGDIDCIDGIEVWSLIFDWIPWTHVLNLPVRYFGFPLNLKKPSNYNLSLWDRWASRKKSVGFAGLDIHPVPFPFLDIKKTFVYRNTFKTLRNHLLVRNALSGNVNEDKKTILDAVKKGHLFFANDFLQDSSGFYFGSPDREFVMGDEIEPGRQIEIKVPVKSVTRMLKNGIPVWEESIVTRKAVLENEGVYRIEVLHKGKHWIFSNHVYVSSKK